MSFLVKKLWTSWIVQTVTSHAVTRLLFCQSLVGLQALQELRTVRDALHWSHCRLSVREDDKVVGTSEQQHTNLRFHVNMHQLQRSCAPVGWLKNRCRLSFRLNANETMRLFPTNICHVQHLSTIFEATTIRLEQIWPNFWCHSMKQWAIDFTYKASFLGWAEEETSTVHPALLHYRRVLLAYYRPESYRGTGQCVWRISRSLKSVLTMQSCSYRGPEKAFTSVTRSPSPPESDQTFS